MDNPMQEKATYSKVLKNLIEDGAHIFGEILDKKQAEEFYTYVKQHRQFDENLFMTEEEYLANPTHKKTNPGDNFNFLKKFEKELSFVEQDEYLQRTIKKLLGENYGTVIKKFVCGVPSLWIPEWVKTLIDGDAVKNLNAYIKPEYRDITYFNGIDLHQDMIDWPQHKTGYKPHEFLTLYVYIHDVTELDSPLYLIPKTHKYGGTIFPHNLTNVEPKSNKWIYKDDKGRELECKHNILTGSAGYVGIWHNCTLHGTQPVAMGQEELPRMRLSLRYLICKENTDQKLGIDEINGHIDGPLSMEHTRRDLAENGKAKIKGNTINQVTA